MFDPHWLHCFLRLVPATLTSIPWGWQGLTCSTVQLSIGSIIDVSLDNDWTRVWLGAIGVFSMWMHWTHPLMLFTKALLSHQLGDISEEASTECLCQDLLARSIDFTGWRSGHVWLWVASILLSSRFQGQRCLKSMLCLDNKSENVRQVKSKTCKYISIY